MSASPDRGWDRYAPYGRLIKMLLPSAQNTALYGSDNALLWCSEGYERMDLRELIETVHERADSESTGMFKAASEASVYIHDIMDDDGNRLGCITIEIGAGRHGVAGESMISGLLRPVIDCMKNQLSLEQSGAEGRSKAHDGLELLLTIDKSWASGSGALEQIVEHCAKGLDATVGALLLPDKGVSICVRDVSGESADAVALDQTQKHVLALVQLSGRPLIVNGSGVTQGAANGKMLAVPVVDDSAGRVSGVLAVFRAPEAADFVPDEQRVMEVISRRVMSVLDSEHDVLTGQLNRIAFEKRAAGMLASVAENVLLFAMYVDVDRMLAINEAFGMQAGDEILKRVAGVIAARLSASDLLCRLGADRFAVLIQSPDRASGESIAGDIARSVVHLGYLHGGEVVPVTVSIGLVEVHGAATVPHVLAAAEFACKRAKLAGGNRVECRATLNSGASLVRRREFAASQLNAALADERFELVRQPVVALTARARQLLGEEILIRMREPTGELVSAGRFLDAALDCRLMPALDRWVITRTLAEVCDGRIDLADSDCLLMLNVSAQSVTGPDYPGFLLNALADSDIPAERICVELRESVVLQDIERSRRFMKPLAEAGVAITIEGFGVGLGTLLQLRQLPLGFVKLDGELVRRISDDRYARSVVLGIATAVASLGVTPVAEHVESEHIAQILRELGIEYGQGFHLGRPRALEGDGNTTRVQMHRLAASH